jgi:AcrR family transcriptional regulator
MNPVQRGICVTLPPVIDRNQRAELAKAARREEILAAARRVVAARGLRGTTIADIADEAGIALGTIYLYFPSKEAVFAALSQHLHGLIAGALTAATDATTLDEVVRVRIANVFAACAENRDLVRLVMLNTDPGSEVAKSLRRADAAHEAPIVVIVEQAIGLGLVRDADPAIMTKLVKGLVTIAVYEAFVVSDGADADKFRDVCIDMVLAYMRPVTGMP